MVQTILFLGIPSVSSNTIIQSTYSSSHACKLLSELVQNIQLPQSSAPFTARISLGDESYSCTLLTSPHQAKLLKQSPSIVFLCADVITPVNCFEFFEESMSVLEFDCPVYLSVSGLKSLSAFDDDTLDLFILCLRLYAVKHCFGILLPWNFEPNSSPLRSIITQQKIAQVLDPKSLVIPPHSDSISLIDSTILAAVEPCSREQHRATAFERLGNLAVSLLEPQTGDLPTHNEWMEGLYKSQRKHSTVPEKVVVAQFFHDLLAKD
ncbi:hypothetical protein RCL1_005757 [Eukaryota sp. TZLM3-RCL]